MVLMVAMGCNSTIETQFSDRPIIMTTALSFSPHTSPDDASAWSAWSGRLAPAVNWAYGAAVRMSDQDRPVLLKLLVELTILVGIVCGSARRHRAPAKATAKARTVIALEQPLPLAPLCGISLTKRQAAVRSAFSRRHASRRPSLRRLSRQPGSEMFTSSAVRRGCWTAAAADKRPATRDSHLRMTDSESIQSVSRRCRPLMIAGFARDARAAVAASSNR